jgi:hypothetical protein
LNLYKVGGWISEFGPPDWLENKLQRDHEVPRWRDLSPQERTAAVAAATGAQGPTFICTRAERNTVVKNGGLDGHYFSQGAVQSFTFQPMSTAAQPPGHIPKTKLHTNLLQVCSPTLVRSWWLSTWISFQHQRAALTFRF